MKNVSIRTAIALIVFGAVVFGLSCGTGNQTANQSQNQNQNAANIIPPISYDRSCDVKDWGDKIVEVRKNIGEKIRDDKELPNIKHDVRKAPDKDYLEAFIGGQVHTDQLDDIRDLLRSFMKSGCVRKVYFVSAAALRSPIDSTARYDAFEMPACDYPSCQGSNGECYECADSSKVSSQEDATSNSNANTNTNSTNVGKKNK